MGGEPGEGGLTPRLFLVAPEKPATYVAACLEAALAAGDVASLLVAPSLVEAVRTLAQGRGVAVLCAGEFRTGADGVQVEAGEVAAARRSLGKDRIVGAHAGTSRHRAMEAGEAGADYIAFSQRARLGGEPIVAWWAELFEIPCVAFDPVALADLDMLLPQSPDFIRPDDAMWESPEDARRIVSELTKRLQRT
jgi:thiamine-phosphate pyrophosphorylase